MNSNNVIILAATMAFRTGYLGLQAVIKTEAIVHITVEIYSHLAEVA